MYALLSLLVKACTYFCLVSLNYARAEVVRCMPSLYPYEHGL